MCGENVMVCIERVKLLVALQTIVLVQASGTLFAHGTQITVPSCKTTYLLPQNTSGFLLSPFTTLVFAGSEAVGRAVVGVSRG